MIALEPRGSYLLVRDVAVRVGARRRGIGTRLMRFAELRASELGFGELRLFTNVSMVENHRFYAKLGYEESGRAVEDGCRRVFYRRRLQPS